MNKQFWIVLFLVAVGAVLFFAIPAAPPSNSLNNDREKASYAFGMNLGSILQKRLFNVDPSTILLGMKDALAGRRFQLSPSEMKEGLALANSEQTQQSGTGTQSSWFAFFSPLKNNRAKAGYAFGVDQGINWKQNRMDLLPEVVNQGIMDMVSGSGLRISPADATEILARYGHELMRRQEKERKELGPINQKAGEAFLARNKLNKDVVSLPCGLQYKVLLQGTGNSPESQNFVILKYRATRIDGSVFDSSDKFTKPMVFPMGGIIRGWSEALSLMKEGAKWQLFIPANEAYGEDGTSNVGPNETLIYDLELVKILPGQPQPTEDEKS